MRSQYRKARPKSVPAPYLTVSSAFASQASGEIWRAGALPLRGQQEALVKEVSRKLFSSEQASDGREAHRGSVSGSEHSWAVQAPPAAPAAVAGFVSQILHFTFYT